MRKKALKRYRLAEVVPHTKATILPNWNDQQHGPPPVFVRSQSLKNQVQYGRLLWWKPFLVLLCIALLCGVTIYTITNFIVQKSIFRPLLGLQSTYVSDKGSMKFPNLNYQAESSVIHTVSKGESFGSIISRYGFDSSVADKIYITLDSIDVGKKNLQILHTNQVLDFKLDKDAQVSALNFKFSDTSQALIKKLEGGEFSGRVVNLPQIEQERLAVGIVKSSFAESANKIGVSYQTINNLVDLFSDRVEFNQDFRVGDRYTVIYQHKLLDDGTLVEDGPILAAAIKVKNKILYAIRYVGADGKERFFNGKGQAIGQGFLRYPVEFTRISSYFSYARFHPVLRVKRPHNGIDFAAPTGTPVRAVSSGKISFAGSGGAGGNMVKIDHNDRYSTAYLHLSKISQNVKRGSLVERGQIIGAVGATGLATGPHLHFSFYDRGKYVDPLKIQLPTLDNLPRGAKIDARYLNRVLKTLQHYQGVDLEIFGNRSRFPHFSLE